MMDYTHEFLRTLAIVLGVAAVTTIVFQRLRQPVVFGYLLAGLIVGPHVPIPLVADAPIVHMLSELGVILLMFSLGLEFSLRRLLRAGWAVVIVAVLQCSFMVWLGYIAGRMFGWTTLECIYAGAAIAISSTTIIVKAFAERGVRGLFTETVFGVLIIEDLFAILLLAVLTPASTGEAVSAGALTATVVRLVGFLAALLGIGIVIVPRIIRFVVKLGRPETTLVSAIGICFATSLLAESIGYSVALGSFLAGSLVAESGEEKIIERLVEPVRDMFAAIFFVSVGMLIDPRVVADEWRPVIVLTLLVVFGKIAAVSVSAFLTGSGTRAAVQTGMSLAQIGEFSFIIAGVGVATGATRPFLYPVAVAVSAITTLLTPWLIRAADPVSGYVDRHLPRPLQTFVALYGTWIERVRLRPPLPAEKSRIRKAQRVLLIDAAAIAVIVLGVVIEARPLVRALRDTTGLSGAAALLLVITVTALLALPFCVGLMRASRTLGQALASRAFPDAEQGRFDPAAAPRRAMVVTIQLLVVLLVGAPLATITQPFFAGPYAVLGLAVILAILGVAFWRSAANLHGHVKAGAEVIVAALAKSSHAAASNESRLLEQVHQMLPGLGSPTPVRLDARDPCVGKELRTLQLRARTGATILAIIRGDAVILMPDGHVALQAGDTLALAGTSEALDAAGASLKAESTR
ncbi:MAG: cation:proton antiporter [bacterium]